MSINIIGAGRVGKTIGRLIVRNQAASIRGVVNRTKKSADEAISAIGQGTSYDGIADLPAADITFITTNDDQIELCAAELAENKQLTPNTIIVHCSGALTSDILMPLKKKGCVIASVHPMKSFHDVTLSVREFPGTYCAVEGDGHACEPLLTLFTSIEATAYIIPAQLKARYHAAAVMASNLFVSLYNESLLCFQQAGLSEPLPRELTYSMFSGVLRNLQRSDAPKKALTGPLMRGDSDTVAKNLESLATAEQKAIYSALSIAALKMTDLTEEQQKNMRTILSAEPKTQ